MVRERFCAECGNTGVPLHDNFCQTCYWKFHSIGHLKQERVKYPYCGECGSLKLSSGWTGPNLQEEIPYNLGYAHFNNIVTPPESIIEIGNISEINWMDPNPEFTITFIVTNDVIEEFSPHSESLDLWVKINKGICSTCIKRKTGSGDITIQFRAKNRKITKMEQDKVTTIAFNLAAELSYENSDAYISDIIENYGGIDLYFGNNYLAELFVEKIKNQWICHYEKNYKLVTEDKDERRVYAITHLLRIPEVVPGDYVDWDNKLHIVHRVSKIGVHLRNLQTNELILSREWSQLKPLDPPPRIVKKLVVSEDQNSECYLIMDLESYDTEEVLVESFPKPLEVSSEVLLLAWNDVYYLEPE